MSDPLHTDAVQDVVSCTFRSQSSTRSSAAVLRVAGIEPPTRTMSGAGVSVNEWVAPSVSTPLSVTIGPGWCHTNRNSADGRPRSIS
ncbi:Uncharacterised protein [Mycobacteroides abscessus subsp. abscessus]|nr:Uncharacterised protein [Mycobacteroides abscessus subsp. abscessus]SLC85236.1 Uncharacterised protein [Mycobacteroides abscessus subsp. massiliense]